MYHFQWQWSYTLYIVVPLLVVFLIAGVVLLLRRPLRRWHHTMGKSISTPYGNIGYWDIDTRPMLAQGVERARTRQYVNPRGER